MEEAADKRIYIACVTSKEFVRKSTKAECAWDSGLANVLVGNLLMLTQAGRVSDVRGRNTSPTGLIKTDSDFFPRLKVD